MKSHFYAPITSGGKGGKAYRFDLVHLSVFLLPKLCAVRNTKKSKNSCHGFAQLDILKPQSSWSTVNSVSSIYL